MGGLVEVEGEVKVEASLPCEREGTRRRRESAIDSSAVWKSENLKEGRTLGSQVSPVVWNCMMYFRSSSRALMKDLTHSTWVLSLNETNNRTKTRPERQHHQF